MDRLDWTEDGLKPRIRRSWGRKFYEAFRGIKRGIRGHSSFFIHFFFAAFALMLSVILELNVLEWCLVLFCIGLVFTTELVNSSIETLFHGLDETTKSRWNPCLEIAAGAVLMASFFTVLIGLLLFLPKLLPR